MICALFLINSDELPNVSWMIVLNLNSLRQMGVGGGVYLPPDSPQDGKHWTGLNKSACRTLSAIDYDD